VTTLIVIIVVVVVLLGGAALLLSRLRRQQLQRQFGPEYERTVDSAGDRRTAERDLQQRTQERKELEIRLAGTVSDRRATQRIASLPRVSSPEGGS
jgi:hypothetical protein